MGKGQVALAAALIVSESICCSRASGAEVFVRFGGGLRDPGPVLCLFGAYYAGANPARPGGGASQPLFQAQATLARVGQRPQSAGRARRLRQKFRPAMNEFTSRGRISTSCHVRDHRRTGSGKSEAIRHSGIDFPPGLQNELQGRAAQ